MKTDWREKLRIPANRLDAINQYLCDPESKNISAFLDVVASYGTIDEINKKANRAGSLTHQMERLREIRSPYVRDLEWLGEQCDDGAFISIDEFRYKYQDERYRFRFHDDLGVTLEISALQYFPWLIVEAKQAIERQELMPGRFIRVRNMQEQEEDHEIMAVGAAMNILGASYVETLDTKGTDGSNIHLGGPETITGYFAGVGQPNNHALKWVDEFLYYFTNYGVRQVLNVNQGTILLAMMLHKLGIDNEFKISVYVGHDNPYFMLSTLALAKLFSRDDGTTPLIGLNFSNSVNNQTIELSAEIRDDLGFRDIVRFEHHILETFKNIVIQPYDRRDELVKLAKSRQVRNVSAKHEGGDIKVEKTREHPSDILNYFMAKKDVEEQGLMEPMLRNYLDKHDAINRTAEALTFHNVAALPAKHAHYR